MGAVKKELRNEGRGVHNWDYITLGDERTVYELLRSRLSQDAGYADKVYPCGEFSGGGKIQFAESIACAYIDLDRLIMLANLTSNQHLVVRLVMQGNTPQDIAESLGKDNRVITKTLDRAVKKICRTNKERWLSVYGVSKS